MIIDVNLVRHLINDQFPQWSSLPIYPVARSGWDNRTFRLGSERLIRMPSAESYASQVSKEQRWLPFLGKSLSLQIPCVLELGKPGREYPWSWSIYRWIEGEDAQSATKVDAHGLAKALARFVRELHSVDIYKGPPAGSHNYFRGGNLREYNQDTLSYAQLLSNEVCTHAVLKIWRTALKSQWTSPSVWVHGDLEASNILLSEGKLTAVIDFGCCAVGDPACDLVMAWTFFDENDRNLFRSTIAVDDDTWARGKAWALWKALFRMSQSLNSCDEEFLDAKRIAGTIMAASA